MNKDRGFNETHRDDAMNSRCNRCEWLISECRCTPEQILEFRKNFDQNRRSHTR